MMAQLIGRSAEGRRVIASQEKGLSGRLSEYQGELNYSGLILTFSRKVGFRYYLRTNWDEDTLALNSRLLKSVISSIRAALMSPRVLPLDEW